MILPTDSCDTFVAGILSQLVTDLSLLHKEEKLRDSPNLANACGALTVIERGAIPALPTKETVLNALVQFKIRKLKCIYLSLVEQNKQVQPASAFCLATVIHNAHISLLHNIEASAEFLKCIKFGNGLHFEIKKAVGYQKICVFADLVDCYRIYEEDSNAHYKMSGHTTPECKHKEVICFNCGEEGHISTQYQKPKKAPGSGKVFSLAGTQTGNEDGLIRGTCFINNTPLVTIIETGSTHCFIAADYVKRLNLALSAMNVEMVVDLPGKGSVTTSLVSLKCPLSIFDKDFDVDLVCLLLRGLDVILVGEVSTHEEEGVDLLSARQLRQLMKEEVQVFSLMASLSAENQDIIEELQVVCEFPEVFPYEIPDSL
ncbi:uncharacterized protein LOC131659135 [Vicia villosa]|uniref:uncharacterized protein LOC131659135 n=1 Tax=Vicia villosa TaxID=3911 RepID=UPI00273B4756|nr:uncharacterized protein LOC131659135 [Vicia villosa]